MIVTGNEVEALHLEQNLIKRHRPPFNIRLRDDKSFPYIAVTVEDDFPRVMFTRERHRRGVVYFGPYANAKKVRETLDVLNRVFPYRPCEGPKPGRHSGIPCLDYHIDRCLAPCVGYISKEDYRLIIEQVMEFLSGETRPMLRELERKMQEAAADERFEEAARYRNRLFAVRHLAERQAADRRAVGTVDVIGIAAEGDRAAVQVFPLRDGQADRPLRLPPRERRRARIADAAGGVRASSTTARRRACRRRSSCRAEWGTPRALEEFLSERRGSRVEVRAAARGEKRRLAELAEQNARIALESDAVQSEQRRLRRVEALEELREALNLESLPIRIECFDISNLQGRVAGRLDGRVPGRAAEEGGLPQVRRARRWTARTTSRRWRRWSRAGSRGRRDATAEEYDDSFAATPNLVVVDGGKGQLSAVLAAMQAFDLPRVAVISLAKREEEVFVPGVPSRSSLDRALAGAPAAAADPRRGAPLRARLPPPAPRRGAKESIFDTLKGVGPARRRALMRHFGSAERFLAASQEELEGVPGYRRRPRGRSTRSCTRPGAAGIVRFVLRTGADRRGPRRARRQCCSRDYVPAVSGSMNGYR